MESTRETKTELIHGIEFTLNTYITGRELRDIEKQMFSNIEIKTVKGENQIQGTNNAKLIQDRADAQIKAVVVAINGSTDDIVNKVLDLRSEIYTALIEKIEEIVSGK